MSHAGEINVVSEAVKIEGTSNYRCRNIAYFGFPTLAAAGYNPDTVGIYPPNSTAAYDPTLVPGW